MKNSGRLVPVVLAGVLAACGGGGGDDAAATASADQQGSQALKAAVSSAGSQVASIYALEFVGTAATGFDLNDAGDVVGTSYPDPGCGPFCLPPEEPVVWKGGKRIALPPVPGFDGGNQHPR